MNSGENYNIVVGIDAEQENEAAYEAYAGTYFPFPVDGCNVVHGGEFLVFLAGLQIASWKREWHI